MTRGFFVTGTSTGVGKTTVAAGLLAALRRRGYRVAALKPAESGCAPGPGGELLAADGELLRAACGLDDLAIDAIVPFRLATAVAPAVAARLENRPFDPARVVAARDALLARAPDLLLVEGAGGLLVPYSDSLLGADLAHLLGLPLLVVASASLGTINHSLLTVFEARRRGLSVEGVILNRIFPEPAPADDETTREIERHGAIRVLGTVAHLPPAERTDPTHLAAAIERALDPTRLFTSSSPVRRRT